MHDDDTYIDDIIRKGLGAEGASGSDEVWQKIHRKMRVWDFFRPGIHHFNMWYVVAFMGITYGAYHVTRPQENKISSSPQVIQRDTAEAYALQDTARQQAKESVHAHVPDTVTEQPDTPSVRNTVADESVTPSSVPVATQHDTPGVASHAVQQAADSVRPAHSRKEDTERVRVVRKKVYVTDTVKRKVYKKKKNYNH